MGKVKELESQFARNLIEASLDPLVTISTAGKITDMNEALAKITGVTRLKLIGSDFFEYFTEPQKAREVYQEVFAKGSVTDSPLTFLHKNGTLTDVLFNGSVYKDDKGNVRGTVIVARDIAEQKWALEIRDANKELAFQNDEKEKRAQELSVANTELAFQNDEKEKRAEELRIANKELAFQNDEKEKRAEELRIANKELAFQNDEKEKRAQELSVANKELAFQNDEKEKRAAELSVANKELAFQNDEKEKRAAELSIANKELAFQNDEKEKRAAELSIANTELAFQNDEKEKRAAELSIANKELAFQNDEKEKRADELSVANKELAFQNNEKEKRADELGVANKELAFQNDEKEKRAAELSVANKELAFQNDEKEKRAAELSIANTELAFQNDEKEKRAAELIIANYARGLIEVSRDPLVTISPLGKLTDMNEATVNITGLTREQLTGTDFFDYFTEPQKAREVYQEVFAKGSVADSPLTLRHKDGKLTDVLFNGSVYKDDKGNVIGVVIVARDVTAQKQASQYARSLIEASLDPLVTISTEGKITDVNEALAEVTGVSRENLIGTDFSNYFTDQEKARDGYKKVFEKSFVSDYPLTIRHKEGKLTEVSYNASVYKDDKGNVLGIFAAARDVTAQKKLAERDIEREKELERLAELERFRKLTVGRELKMIELKKEIEELKGKLGVSKDENY
ncbi:MAG: hybrid sensor histidine kinase/response regulator [Bacteroidetes bacterium]|nr:hybrid sensor histidine kinase/response regulator [Bacteroidota bacterium]